MSQPQPVIQGYGYEHLLLSIFAKLYDALSRAHINDQLLSEAVSRVCSFIVFLPKDIKQMKTRRKVTFVDKNNRIVEKEIEMRIKDLAPYLWNSYLRISTAEYSKKTLLKKRLLEECREIVSYLFDLLWERGFVIRMRYVRTTSALK